MIRGAIEHPYMVTVGVLVTLVLGIVAYRELPADLLPTFDTPAVQIVTFYPGMPPEVVERDITSRFERWTAQSIGIEHQEAKSMLGVSIIKDYFRDGISLDTAMSQVSSYAVSDMFYQPPGTIPPMVMPFDPTASLPLCLVSVSSPTLSQKELYDVAYFELRNRLQSIPGVIAPAVFGGKLRRILAYADREKLEAHDMSLMDVVRALRKQSVFIPAGNMKAGDTDYQIFANAMPEQVSQLNDIPVAVREGRVIFMRDVASVQDSSQIQSNIVRINGRQQVYIPIYRQPGANTLSIVDAIRARLTQINQRLREMNPKAKDLALGVVLDQSVYVRHSINGLGIAALLGALFAGLVVLLFLRSWRSTLIIALAIPLSILAAAVGLFAMGQTINTLTLAGVVLAIGILVDQCIVVVENVARHRRMGKNAMRAALDGAREVGTSIVVAVLTFTVVFLPVVFLSGMAHFLFTPLAVASTLVVGASLIVALTVVPAFCSRFVPMGPKGHADGRSTANQVGLYARSLAWVLRRRQLVVGAALLVTIASLFAMGRAGTELFPKVDAGQLEIYVHLRSGTRIEDTEKIVARVERVIMSELGQPDPEYPKVERHPESDLRMLITNIGVLNDWPAAYTPNAGPMDAFVLVQLKPGRRDVFRLADELRQHLTRDVPEAQFAFNTGGMLTAALNFGEPAPIHYQVKGSNLRVLDDIGARVARDLSGVDGAVDVRVMQRDDYPTLHVDIDRTKAALVGLTVEEVMHNLVTATNSSINFAPSFWIDPKNGNHYFIGAQYPESALVSVQTLLDIPITPSSGGKAIPLRTIATVRRGTGPAFVSHRNITRVVDVYADVGPGRNLGRVVGAMERRLSSDPGLGLERFVDARGHASFHVGGEYAGRGYTLSASGEITEMRDAFTQFAIGLLLAIVLVYLIMVAHLRSFLDPLMILSTIPLGFIGIAPMLLATSTPLNIPSMMGILLMVGIVVEHGIILVDFANARLRQGYPKAEAAAHAAQVRLRPIMMTGLAAVLALVPMATGLGGTTADAPLARTVIAAVVSSSVLTLFVLPCLYVLMKRSPKTPAATGDERLALDCDGEAPKELAHA